MQRSIPVTLLAVLVGACGGPPPSEAPSPVRTLAQMSAAGALDPVRLGCAMEAVPSVTDELGRRLPELRAERAARSAEALSSHARSVQDNMRASDVMTGAALQSIVWQRSAEYQTSQGNFTRAAQYSAYAGRVWLRAHGGGADLEEMAIPVPYLSDEEVRLLVDYAVVRADLAAGLEEPTAERMAELDGFELAHPELLEAYTRLLLHVYEDPEFACGS